MAMNLIRKFLFGSLIIGASACATQGDEGSVDSHIKDSDGNYKDTIAVLGCNVKIPKYPDLGETPTCDLPVDKQIAHTCSWETHDRELGEPKLSFGIRNLDCSFSNKKQTRAICAFEYITTPYLGYGEIPPEASGDIWQNGRAAFANMTWGDIDEMGHLMFFTRWEADQDCRK